MPTIDSNLYNSGVEVEIVNLGLLPYAEAANLQDRLVEKVQEGRNSVLLLVQHPPVYTLGANFHDENLLFSPEEYAARGIEIHRTPRGGDVTYHGPGQLVIYPIFNLKELKQDLHWWLRSLEEAIILSIKEFGLTGVRSEVNTGVWVGDKKIAAIGIKVRRWVSLHGIALNCNNDLNPFDWIVPCGIKTHGVTSLTREISKDVLPIDAIEPVVSSFQKVFGLSLRTTERSRLFEELGLITEGTEAQ